MIKSDSYTDENVFESAKQYIKENLKCIKCGGVLIFSILYTGKGVFNVYTCIRCGKKHKELDGTYNNRAMGKHAQQQVKNCAISPVGNSLDLVELERKLDESLGKETKETLTEWLKRQRQ